MNNVQKNKMTGKYADIKPEIYSNHIPLKPEGSVTNPNPIEY